MCYLNMRVHRSRYLGSDASSIRASGRPPVSRWPSTCGRFALTASRN